MKKQSPGRNPIKPLIYDLTNAKLAITRGCETLICMDDLCLLHSKGFSSNVGGSHVFSIVINRVGALSRINVTRDNNSRDLVDRLRPRK